MKRIVAKAALLGLVSLALMADSCDEKIGTVRLYSVYLDAGGATRAASPSVKVIGPGKQVGPAGTEAYGDFKVASGVPGMLVLRFGTGSSYETCTLDLDGQHVLPVRSAPGGNYQVSQPTGALVPGRTVSGSLTCEGNVWLSTPGTALFTVSTRPSGRLVPTPASMDFGNQAVDTPTASRTVAVQNMGEEPATVSEVGVTQTNAFPIVRDGCSNRTLAPRASCQVEVLFKPPQLGAFSGDLFVDSNALVPFPLVRLSGTSAAGSGPIFVSSVAALDFGTVDIGNTTWRAVTIRNTGATPFTITGGTVSGDPQFQMLADGCEGRTLNTGGSCITQVQFVPTVAGNASGLLQFQDTAPGSPHWFNLTATANDPAPPPPADLPPSYTPPHRP